MAAKVAFDYVNRRIKPTVSPDVNGQIILDVQVDLYSDGKEDWLADAILNKMRFPIEPIGGQVVSSGKLGATYILINGWRIDPNLGGENILASTQVGVATVLGGSGTDEAVRQGFQLPHDGYVREGFLTVRRVGTPTDDLSIEVKDALGQVYESVSIPGGAMETSFSEEFFGSELESVAPKDTQLYFEFTRTGARDTNNYYELALDNDVYALGEAESSDNSVWSSLSGDIVMRYRLEVPYQLLINGNLYTDSGLSAAIPAGNVNVQQTVSTLVEAKYEQALEDIRRLFFNAFKTDPSTGEMVVYDDDGITPLFTADIWEDVAKTQPYQGRGIERRDAFEDGAGGSV